MLTSFFSKSKPFNFIVVSLYLIGTSFFVLFLGTNIEFSFPRGLSFSMIIVSLLFLLFLLNFIIKKNKLSQNNTYAIFFFSVFAVLFPAVFKEYDVVFSTIFLVLALRRILSLPSEKNTDKKILDASLWITIATLFYFWSLLFFIVLWFAIFQLNIKTYKQILIPFVGISAVFILTTVYNLVVNDTFLWFANINTNVNFDVSAYKLPSIAASITLLILALVVSVFQKTKSGKTTPIKEKLRNAILFLYIIIGILLIVITPLKNGSEFIFLLAPLAIFTGHFIEGVSKKWISETVLWLAILSPFVIYFL